MMSKDELQLPAKMLVCSDVDEQKKPASNWRPRGPVVTAGQRLAELWCAPQADATSGMSFTRPSTVLSM
jgi:hypothetical protein